MKQKLNTLQNMCFDISTKENGKYYAWCEYSGHGNLIEVRICLKTDEHYNPIFEERIWLNRENPDQQLQETIDSLICYL